MHVPHRRLKRLAGLTAMLVLGTAPVLGQDEARTLEAPTLEALCPGGVAEAPQLAALVEAGDLPPAAERLPAEPLVIVPAEQNGTYGGQFVDSWGGGNIVDMRQFGYEPLVRWSVDGSEIVPGVAKGWEISEDATTFTFFLREGLRWSDGELFTADDIVFWWDRIESNRQIMTGGPRVEFLNNGRPPTVTKIDELTVEFRYEEPYGLFMQHMAGPYGQRVVEFASHYMEQFDIDANPDGVAEMMAEAGQTEYAAWWRATIGTYGDAAQFNNPERPFVHAWIPTGPLLGRERVSLERNPYYFAIDPGCQQLPYMDTRTFALAADPEVTLLQALQGNITMSPRGVSIPQNRAVFFDNQDAGQYRLVNARSCDYNTAVLAFSVNHPDPVKAEVFQSRDFRAGVSLAINRQEIIDTVYLGQGEPFQPAPLPDSPFYNEAMAKDYTEFDLERAADHLERILPMGPDGVRLGPDGQPFSFAVTIHADFKPDTVDAFQLIERTWRQAGLDATLNVLAEGVFRNTLMETETEAGVWVGENGCGQLPLLNLSRFLNDYGGWSLGNWRGWYSWDRLRIDPEASLPEGWEPVEPPANVQRLYELRSLIPTTVGEEQDALMAEFTELSAEEFLTIGIATPAGFYRSVDRRLRNVPEPLVEGWLYPGPGPANFASFYFED